MADPEMWTEEHQRSHEHEQKMEKHRAILGKLRMDQTHIGEGLSLGQRSMGRAPEPTMSLLAEALFHVQTHLLFRRGDRLRAEAPAGDSHRREEELVGAPTATNSAFHKCSTSRSRLCLSREALSCLCPCQLFHLKPHLPTKIIHSSA